MATLTDEQKKKAISLDNLNNFLSKLKIFKKINVGSTTIDPSDYKSEITFVEGDNITMSADSTNNKITISSNIDVFTRSGASASKGIVPTPPITAGNKKYLCEDGTWAIPDATRFAKETGIGYYSAGDSSCEVKLTVPTNNYVIQLYSSNNTLLVTDMDYNTDGFTVYFNSQSTPGAIYIVTTEVEYTSDIDGTVAAIGNYNANATTCDVPLELDVAFNYSIDIYNSKINTKIRSYSYDSTAKKVVVTFDKAQTNAGSVCVIARKAV